ncbi:MAG: hypothetical protein A3F91_15310 [Flavobacteria bacterium RIFCSPLOWO2_12_FULL_35_11]|nr:MAG: hypothetical protein A3F91_15310 [Flavobacteria bacterium RIFCSPLOWO2_12_FULL_35_11]
MFPLKSGRALRSKPSLRAERGNLLNIFLNKLATPGFPLQSLTQLELIFNNFIFAFLKIKFENQ